MTIQQTSLLYIHGFNSSSHSWKAQQLRAHFERAGQADRLLIPDLPPRPREAMAMLERCIAGAGPVALVGSSLGGHYANWLAAHHGLRAVLVNPAVRPWRTLDGVPEQMHNYHTGEAWRFDRGWLDELRHYEVAEPAEPRNLLVLLQTGDETLDWREAYDYFADCNLYRGVGGSHGFDDFDAFIPVVLRFCGISLVS